LTDDKAGRRPIAARNLIAAQRMARAMALWGITPNAVSAFGLAVGVGAGLALGATAVVPGYAGTLWIAAALMVLLRGLSNMFDGMIAVEQSRGTATGILWNEVPDRISDAVLLIGAGYSLGGSPVAGWTAACLALFVSYLRILIVLAGAPADFGGPFAKQQRMFSVAGLAAILAVVPESWRFAWGPGGAWGPMAVLLWIMVPGIVWTVALRLRRALRVLNHTVHQKRMT